MVGGAVNHSGTILQRLRFWYYADLDPLEARVFGGAGFWRRGFLEARDVGGAGF